MKNFQLPENRGMDLSRRDGYEVSVENSLGLLHANQASQVGMDEPHEEDLDPLLEAQGPISSPALSYSGHRPGLLSPLFSLVLPGYVLIWLASKLYWELGRVIYFLYELDEYLGDFFYSLVRTLAGQDFFYEGLVFAIVLGVGFFFVGLLRFWKNIPFLPPRWGLVMRFLVLVPLLQFISGLYAGLTNGQWL